MKQKRYKVLYTGITNENGTALVLSLILLAVMSIIGISLLDSTDTEISISRNQRASYEAFAAADRAVQYATVAGAVYSVIGTDFVDLTDKDASTESAHEAAIAAGVPNNKLMDSDTLEAGINRVSFLRSGPLPPGSGSDPTYFETRYYGINVVAEGPNNSQARVDAEIGRVVAK